MAYFQKSIKPLTEILQEEVDEYQKEMRPCEYEVWLKSESESSYSIWF